MSKKKYQAEEKEDFKTVNKVAHAAPCSEPHSPSSCALFRPAAPRSACRAVQPGSLPSNHRSYFSYPPFFLLFVAQSEEEINKYSLDENLNDLQKIQTIMMKGFPVQKFWVTNTYSRPLSAHQSRSDPAANRHAKYTDFARPPAVFQSLLTFSYQYRPTRTRSTRTFTRSSNSTNTSSPSCS